MKKIILISLMLMGGLLLAQDPASSQFFFNPMYLNPAFAGTTKGGRVGGVYRNQWPNVPSKFVTYNAWGDIYNPLFHGGLGFIAQQDISGEGLMKTTTFGLIQSFERAIPKIVRIRAGYNVSMINKRVDWSKLVFSDQLDAVQGQIYQSKAIPGAAAGKIMVDFDAGFMLDFPKFRLKESQITNTFGYVANHLTQPNQALTGGNAPLPMKHTVHYTMVISIADNNPNEKSLYISPNIIWEKQGNFTTSNFGFYVTRDPLIAGLFYRKKQTLNFKDSDAFILYLGLRKELSETVAMRVGYSYDVTISRLTSNTMGSHEVSLIFEFKRAELFSKNHKLHKRNKRAMECEDFGSKSMIF
ncbi:MAG: PorP/SprF family type IX secretion system membrane protein [Bacteroidia bacterium]